MLVRFCAAAPLARSSVLTSSTALGAATATTVQQQLRHNSSSSRSQQQQQPVSSGRDKTALPTIARKPFNFAPEASTASEEEAKARAKRLRDFVLGKRSSPLPTTATARSTPSQAPKQQARSEVVKNDVMGTADGKVIESHAAFDSSGPPPTNAPLASPAEGNTTTADVGVEKGRAARRRQAKRAKRAAARRHARSPEGVAAAHLIKASDVVFAAENPLAEALKQIGACRRDWAESHRRMREGVFRGAARLIAVANKKAGRVRRGGGRGGRGGGRGSGSTDGDGGVFSGLGSVARSPTLNNLRQKQMTRAHILREQLLPMAAGLCDRAYAAYANPHNSADGEGSNNSPPQPRSVWATLRSGRGGNAPADTFAVHDDNEVARRASPNAKAAAADSTYSTPSAAVEEGDDSHVSRNTVIIPLPTFEEIGMLLRCAVEADAKSDAIVMPLMRCLKARLEMRQLAVEEAARREAAGAGGEAAPTSNGATAAANNQATTTTTAIPSTYELDDDGLWSIVEGDEVDAKTAATNSNGTQSATNGSGAGGVGTSTSSTASASGNVGETKTANDDDATTTTTNATTDDLLTAPLHPRLAAEILSCSASLGAMEEAMLLAILEFDVNPQRRDAEKMTAGTIVVLMEALGRFGYHKERDSLFFKLGKQLIRALEGLRMDKDVLERGMASAAKLKALAREEAAARKHGNWNKKDSNSANSTSRVSPREHRRLIADRRLLQEAIRRRVAITVSVPTRSLLSLFRYIAESPIRDYRVVHGLAELVSSRCKKQMQDTMGHIEGARQQHQGGLGGGGRRHTVSSSKKSPSSPSSRKRSSANQAPLTGSALSYYHRLCADALETVLHANGFETTRSALVNRRVNQRLATEQREAERRAKLWERAAAGDTHYDEEEINASVDDELADPTQPYFSSDRSGLFLVPTLTAHDVQSVCKLLQLMAMPYDPLETIFVDLIMRNEKGAIMAREPRQESPTEGIVNNGSVDYIKAQAAGLWRPS